MVCIRWKASSTGRLCAVLESRRRLGAEEARPRTSCYNIADRRSARPTLAQQQPLFCFFVGFQGRHGSSRGECRSREEAPVHLRLSHRRQRRRLVAGLAFLGRFGCFGKGPPWADFPHLIILTQDTIKTRAQIAPPGSFTGPMDVARRTLAQEGFLGFYKGKITHEYLVGMASPLVGVAGVNSLLFGAYAVSKRLVSPYPDLSVLQTALAGSMAGAVNSLLASPVEMFKVRMQAQYGSSHDLRSDHFASPLFPSIHRCRVFLLLPLRLRDAVRLMWQEWGFRNGIMRGFWVTVAREIPAYAARKLISLILGFYTGFEVSKRAFQKRYGSADQTLPVWTLLCSGAMGGIGYWTCCYPLGEHYSPILSHQTCIITTTVPPRTYTDVIKSRVQMADRPPQGINYIADTWRKICREEGGRALFRGLMPTCKCSCEEALSGSSHPS
ncbi:uncharacterized protein VP01_87g2 [Puccinia sorghi]|uniref:Mitochondrial carrier protein n=1 Tax=Puccinia sorghi TaxID=27349 RepID=A0A0L6U8C6_9BASI|nr:uncharacterized protein VP01_87g2 [Puccinia sorghi]